MAIGIMISTFGCNNGLILAGARVYYAMARDGLFFTAACSTESRAGARLGAGAAGRVGGYPRPAANLRRSVPDIRQSLQQPAGLRDIRSADFLHPDNRRRLSPATNAAGRRAAIPGVRLPGRAGAVHHRSRDDPADALRLPDVHDVAGAGHRAARRAGLFRMAPARPGLTRHQTTGRSPPSETATNPLANHGRGHVGHGVAR